MTPDYEAVVNEIVKRIDVAVWWTDDNLMRLAHQFVDAALGDTVFTEELVWKLPQHLEPHTHPYQPLFDSRNYFVHGDLNELNPATHKRYVTDWIEISDDS